MVRISRKWFKEGCPPNDGDGTITVSESLDVDSFKGLFLIAGLSSATALAIFLSIFLHENRFVLSSTASIKQKLYLLSSVFYQEENDNTSTISVDPAQSLATCITCDSHAAESSTTQPIQLTQKLN